MNPRLRDIVIKKHYNEIEKTGTKKINWMKDKPILDRNERKRVNPNSSNLKQ
jgi:hypothetical protein